MACRITALAVCAWVVVTSWRPMMQVLTTHEVRIELRPAGLVTQPPMPRWI